MFKSVSQRRNESSPEKLFLLKQVMLLLLVFLVSSVTAGENYSFKNRKISTTSSKTNYAVIFDAGSSGSRVHVFNFDQNLDLLFIGTEIEIFSQIKPGLSAYADDPEKAAASLIPLLEKAESTVPQDLHYVTPLRLGATAGLRFLEGDKSDKILEAVRNLIKTKSNFKYEADEVSVLEGTEEGSYQWLTINYLLENLGKKYGNTVGVIDLGGGSVQMAYAISDEEAGKAPVSSGGKNKYIQNLKVKGTKYNLYVHSYLRYGLQAARVEILKVTKDYGNPCVLTGFEGTYTYGGEEYRASAPRSGSSFNRCRKVILEALKINKACSYDECTFDGIWNGGGGNGSRNLYVASFFFDKAAQAGFIDSEASEAVVKPIDFKKAAKSACRTKFDEAKSRYPNVYASDLQFVCMDLAYEYALLVDGFGIHPQKKITMVKKVGYHGSVAEAAWPLGNAIAVVSSSKYSTADH